MRIRILSDLHMEFGDVEIPDLACDCVVLAGDINTKHHGFDWARKRFGDTPVLYVLGNHEFYGGKLPKITEELRALAREANIHVLENDSVTVGGIHFFGCTLWTDMALNDHWSVGASEAAGVMNDYKRIRNSDRKYRRLSTHDTRMLHLRSLAAMESFFAAHDAAQSVIITHHAPSPLSLPAHRKEKLISCAYASRLDDFVLRHQPRLWVHGHIHHSNDYQIGVTRVLSNPRAYPDEPNAGFIADLMIEL